MFGPFRRGFRPDIDDAQADRELRDARDRAVRGEWTAARDLLAATEPAAASTTQPTNEPINEPTPGFINEPTPESTPGPTSEPDAGTTTGFDVGPNAGISADPATRFTTDPTARPSADSTTSFPADPAARPSADPTTRFPADPAARFGADPGAGFPADPAARFGADPAARFGAGFTARSGAGFTARSEVGADAGSGASDRELRDRRLTVLAAAAGRELRWLAEWEAAVPDDPDAAVLRAQALLDQARSARGGGAARHTSRRQSREFERLSALATEAGRRAIRLSPADPYPWVSIAGSMFATGDRRAFMSAISEATARDPLNFEAHLSRVSFVCEKWFGSHAEMFDAARSVAAGAPPGSPVTMLPVLAHFEFALREYGFDSRDGSLSAKAAHFRRSEVAEEVAVCGAKWRAAGEPSLLGRGIMLRHWLALAHFLSARGRDDSRDLLDQIGPYLGDTPAYGYFWLRQTEGFRVVRRWAAPFQ